MSAKQPPREPSEADAVDAKRATARELCLALLAAARDEGTLLCPNTADRL